MQVKIYWEAINDTIDKVYSGNSLCTYNTIDSTELNIFQYIDNLPSADSINYVCLKIELNDGSGVIKHFEKQQNAWLLKFEDDILPPWVVWGFLALVVTFCTSIYLMTC